MAVKEGERNPSSFDTQDKAKILCNKIIVLVHSNFGIEVKEETDAVGEWKRNDNGEIEISATVRSNKVDITGSSLILEFERDGVVYLKSYKTWLIKHFKEDLWKYSQDLSYHIRVANTINPILVREYEERRINQDKAIACCLHLLDLLDQAKEILHVKISKVDPIISLLNEEFRLLKGWRKSDYGKLRGCIKREKKVQLQAIESLKKDIGRAIKKKKELQNPNIRGILFTIEETINAMKNSINETPDGEPSEVIDTATEDVADAPKNNKSDKSVKKNTGNKSKLMKN